MTLALAGSLPVLLLHLFLSTSQESDAAKILGIFPFFSKSHMALNTGLMKELARRGHEVTVFRTMADSESVPNYKFIKLRELSFKDMSDSSGNQKEVKKLNPFDILEMNYFQTNFMLWGFGTVICDKILPEEKLQQLMKTKEKYDILVLDSFYMDCLLGFSHKLNTSVIQTVGFAGTVTMNDFVGNPSPYSYVPDPFREFSDKMNFKERLLNSIGQVFQKIGRKFYFVPIQDRIMKKHFNDPNMPSVNELIKKTVLLLVNHHFSISYPRPMVPNAIQVGGMHIKSPRKLSVGLQKFMDEAPHGVIYFSMGSNLKSSDMPEEVVNAFVQAFSKLKQRVLWKWESESLPAQPPNLKLGKWLPQSDILAHRNIRVFITHGGLLSTQETIHRGVPVVGIPIYGDQKLNMIKTEAMGFGITLDFRNITEQIIRNTLKEVLENPKYKENAERLSRIYREQPLTPLDTAVYWTEYVIRHKGAPHMRSAALDLSWYQYFLLDVIAVLMLVVFSIIYISYLLLRTFLRKCCGGSQHENKISEKIKKN